MENLNHTLELMLDGEAIPKIARRPAVSMHKLANNGGGNYSNCAKHE